MITPEKMTQFEKNKVIEIYTKLNTDITSQIIKKLQQDGDISTYTQYQIQQLARQGGKEIFYESLNKVNGISKKQKKELEKLFNDVQKEELKDYKDLKLTPAMVKLTNQIYKKTNKTLKNMTKTIAFSSKQTYVNALDELYMKVSTGSQDYDSAMKGTIKELAEKGVTLQSKGRNYKLESTVKMNLMASIKQTANDLSKEIGEEIGANCVVIGHTPYCRPTHQVIDGIVMSIDKFKKYEELTEEPNCYHIVNYDWRPEFENKKNKVVNEEHLSIAEYNKNYNIREKQNYYARQVRNKKEQVNILNKSDKRNNITQEELIKAKKELRNAQTKYRQFSNSQNIDTDYTLTWKYGYNK